MDRKITFLSYGLGSIGIEILRSALHLGSLTPVGAVDKDPSKVGTDVAELLGLESALGVKVCASLAEALEQARPDVVFHATGSYLEDVADQLAELLEAGLPTVSTCEELAYPWRRHPEIARKLDHVALERRVALVGTGVNPGFAMDTLPIALSAVCANIRAVEVHRVVNVARRRRALQEKMGLGMSADEYYTRLGAGRFGHVGLEESAWMVAAAFGWELEDTESTVEPIIADRPKRTAYFYVPEGHVCGTRQTTSVACSGGRQIFLELLMEIEPSDERDEVKLDSDPPVHTVVKGGLFGDTATAAIVVNTAFSLLKAPPGLRSMWELTYVHHSVAGRQSGSSLV